MAQLLVRNVDDSVVKALKARAARNGRSTEAEHREILRSALAREHKGSLKELLLRMPHTGADADFSAARDRARRVRL
ncbi:MAG TPA: DNA-binding protein [Polyangia bacterium]|nr:DNA-binding protein [Polyangia bacterium]